MSDQVRDRTQDVLDGLSFQLQVSGLIVFHPEPMLHPISCPIQVQLRDGTLGKTRLRGNSLLEKSEGRLVTESLPNDLFGGARKGDGRYVGAVIKKKPDSPIQLVDCRLDLGHGVFHAV